MPQTSWEVRAETFEGNEFVLRRGFTSREDAEEHPVKLSLWQRVWVQEVAPPPSAAPLPGNPSPATLRLPWRREDGAHGRLTYVRDADGGRILTVHGSVEQRDRLFAILFHAGLYQPDRKADAAD